MSFAIVGLYSPIMQIAENQNPKRHSVLVVDDEEYIRHLIGQILENKYDVMTAANANEAVALMSKTPPSVVLLDIYMPGDDGVTLCQKLRENPQTREVPVIMMTAMDSRDTRIRSFSSGADDFLSKPFDLDELCARIESKLRRVNERETIKARTNTITLGDISLDVETFKASVGERPVDLGFIEFRILSHLVRNVGVLVKRDELEASIWGDDRPASRALDTHIASLRKKLGPSQISLRTVYGEGFVLEQKPS